MSETLRVVELGCDRLVVVRRFRVGRREVTEGVVWSVTVDRCTRTELSHVLPIRGWSHRVDLWLNSIGSNRN